MAISHLNKRLALSDLAVTLTDFITELLEQGSVTLPGEIHPFGSKDQETALSILHQYYEKDKLEMPGQPPAFEADAAVWAAKYLYGAMQLTLLRNIGEEKIPAYLTPFTGTLSAEAIYSTDLMLRYLPDTLNLAKGLAPDDALVVYLKKTAVQWPFSSVGVAESEIPDVSLILAHASLKQAYLDRIIQKRDSHRAKQPAIHQGICEVLGTHTKALWPDFQYIINY